MCSLNKAWQYFELNWLFVQWADYSSAASAMHIFNNWKRLFSSVLLGHTRFAGAGRKKKNLLLRVQDKGYVIYSSLSGTDSLLVEKPAVNIWSLGINVAQRCSKRTAAWLDFWKVDWKNPRRDCIHTYWTVFVLFSWRKIIHSVTILYFETILTTSTINMQQNDTIIPAQPSQNVLIVL